MLVQFHNATSNLKYLDGKATETRITMVDLLPISVFHCTVTLRGGMQEIIISSILNLFSVALPSLRLNVFVFQ